MIITVSGKAGTGKSTVAKLLAKRLGLRHYSSGDLQRQIAKEKGVSLLELQKLEESSSELDNLVDEKTKKLGEQDGFVIDARLAYYFIPHATLKVFLDATLDVRARRIFGDERTGESFATVEDAKEAIRVREESEQKRYRAYYGLDYGDVKQYDVVVDTSDLSVGETYERIVSALPEK